MKIIVEYNSNVLGSGIFWEGDSMDVGEIRNIVARNLALHVRMYGGIKKDGMWTAYSKESKNEN